MHDFKCTDPSEMHYEILAERTRFFKESKEGVLTMCRSMEKMREESLRECAFSDPFACAAASAKNPQARRSR